MCIYVGDVNHYFFTTYFFSRDQRLHKLVFEEDGLPDGTEVAYYARGKVRCMCI